MRLSVLHANVSTCWAALAASHWVLIIHCRIYNAHTRLSWMAFYEWDRFPYYPAATEDKSEIQPGPWWGPVLLSQHIISPTTSSLYIYLLGLALCLDSEQVLCPSVHDLRMNMEWQNTYLLLSWHFQPNVVAALLNPERCPCHLSVIFFGELSNIFPWFSF